jgi:hypothetical protein
MMRVAGRGLLAAVLLVPACDPNDRSPLEIESTGTVLGSAFIDNNGNGIRDAADPALPNLRVRLLIRGTPDSVASRVTGADGRFRIEGVPTGEYDVVVDPATVPDTLQIASIGNGPARVLSLDSVNVDITAGFPAVSIAEVRNSPIGRRLFIDAVALNNRDAFADGAVHVYDGADYIRLTSLRAGDLVRGNRARFLGVVQRQSGQTVLNDVQFFVTDSVVTPPPLGLTTARAANADGGDLDAALITVARATITSTQAVGNEYRFTLDDGTGAVEASVILGRGFELALLVPGTELNVTGMLVPASGIARWQLRPRSPDDVSLGFPTVTVAEARSLPVGERVIILGIALNDRSAFGDSSVHIADGTGAIRGTAFRPGTVLAGDRARFLGTISRRDGQPTIDDVTAFVLDIGGLPSPALLDTERAATANNGVFDAAHVQVRQATITDTASVGLFLRIGVNDGTGRLEVEARKSGNFEFENYGPGRVLDATGVMIPVAGQNVWRLRARTNADIRVEPVGN